MKKISNFNLFLATVVFATCFFAFFFDPFQLINRDRFDYFSEEIVECSMLNAGAEGWPGTLGLGVYLPKEQCRARFKDSSITRVSSSDLSNLTDDNWQHGLSRYAPIFLVPRTYWNMRRYMPGERLEFPDGTVRAVTETSISNLYVTVHLDGPIDGVFDRDFKVDNLPPPGEFIRYGSQIGGPGFLFSLLHRSFGQHDVNFYRGFNIALLSLCIAFVSYLLAIEFGMLEALTLPAISVLSPWLINVAGNLYWMAWTWYLPTMLTLWIVSQRGGEPLSTRFGLRACAAYFAVVALRCTCGYEYLPSILITSFLPIVYVWVRDRFPAADAIKAVFKVGVSGCVAFGAVLVAHAYLRAGSLITGIQQIASDVSRRTYASGIAVQESLGNGASLVDVLKLYFGKLFQPIIVGVTAPFYATLAVLAIFSIALLAAGGKRKALGVAFFISILSPISWIIAAKGHSFVHPHINAVLWDFPTVPLGAVATICSLRYLWQVVASRLGLPRHRESTHSPTVR